MIKLNFSFTFVVVSGGGEVCLLSKSLPGIVCRLWSFVDSILSECVSFLLENSFLKIMVCVTPTEKKINI